jgi:phosphatidylserine/phosphatidylglycerophosphate/cardiolipin synthase-like enzyme
LRLDGDILLGRHVTQIILINRTHIHIGAGEVILERALNGGLDKTVDFVVDIDIVIALNDLVGVIVNRREEKQSRGSPGTGGQSDPE